MQGDTLQSSLRLVVTVPTVEYNRLYDTQAEPQGSLITPCIIDARWVRTDTTFDPKASDLVQTSHTAVGGQRFSANRPILQSIEHMYVLY